MHPLLLAAEDCHLCRDELVGLGQRLRDGSDELDDLLARAIEQSLDRAFTHLSLAAIHFELPVDARHLRGGAHLLPNPGILARLAGHCHGDVAAALIEAVKDGRLSWEREGTALLLGTWWDQERGECGCRKALVRQARLLCRRPLSITGLLLVVATAQVLDDEELSELVSRLAPNDLEEDAASMRTSLIGDATRPVMEGLPERPQQGFPDWRPRRRAAPRIGRNEPCPCGSGKKYKRCCLARDQQRLRDSSDVAGVTRSELRRNLEEHLSWNRLDELRAHELARLDPRRIDPGLQVAVVRKLILFSEFEAALRFFQTQGLAPELYDHLMDAVEAAIDQRRTEDARALLELVEEPLEEMWMSLGMLVLTKGLEESPVLTAMERLASTVVDGAAVDFACDLLASRWPHLGILVARGVLPLAPSLEYETLLSSIGEARDRLDLPAIDPIEGALGSWFDEELDSWPSKDLELGTLRASEKGGGGHTDFGASDEPEPTGSERSEEAPDKTDAEPWQELEAKEREVRRLRDQLAELDNLLQEQNGKTSAAAEESRPEIDPRLIELRDRVHRLKGELNQRHAERNRFRRQLENMRKKVDALEAQHEEAPPSSESRVSAAVREPEGFASSMPARLPMFSERFRKKLGVVPDGVKRRAILVVGRIAAGDPAALRGARRLHVDRDLFRQRIGRDYRLLFRLLEDEIEVVDLLPRQDLERTLRELR